PERNGNEKAVIMMLAGAIVCGEIALDRSAILYAARSEPVDEIDSGWQFLCGARTENPATASVWALGHVLTYEPSLETYLAMPAGTVLSRQTSRDRWIVNA